jgi:hypothetical protein
LRHRAEVSLSFSNPISIFLYWYLATPEGDDA